jgi:hypothetical protein
MYCVGPPILTYFMKTFEGFIKKANVSLMFLFPDVRIYIYISGISLTSWYATFTLNFVRLYFKGIVSIFCMSYKAQNFDGLSRQWSHYNVHYCNSYKTVEGPIPILSGQGIYLFPALYPIYCESFQHDHFPPVCRNG